MSAAVALAALCGYLVGSVPVAVLVGRRHGVELRHAGDRNPGWWNAKATLGRRAAVPVFVGDTAKGAVGGLVGLGSAYALGAAADGGAHAATWAGVAGSMVGHAWPLFARFRGGRSILCFVGGLAVLSPRTFVGSLVLLVAAWAITRRFAVAARVAVFGSALVSLLVDGPHRTAALGVLMTLIGVRFGQAALADRRARAPTTPPPTSPTPTTPPPTTHPRPTRDTT